MFASGANNRNMDSGAESAQGHRAGRSTHQSIGTKPTRALKDDVIYEVHVRGLTENRSEHHRAPYRGTYKGAALKGGYLAAWASRRWSSCRCRRRRTTPTT